MKSSSSIIFVFFFALFSAAAAAAAAGDSNHPLLPRPLIIEYVEKPSEIELLLDRGTDEDLDEVRLRCDSWRVAGEANNLAPWVAVPPECEEYVREYVNGKAYLYDLEMVANEATKYARSVKLAGDGKDAWVFDIDETLLSNLAYYAEHQFGAEVFNSQKFAEWVEKAIAPAIESTLKVYEEVLRLGFKVILLTGRSEAHRNVTVDNLIKAGYREWEDLILRSVEDRPKPAPVYKSEKRLEMVSNGYRLWGNSGDQWSDLLGACPSNRSFKLPNPLYYIP